MERNKSTQMCGRCINMYVVSALNHQPAGNMLAAIHRSHRSGSDYARRQKKQEENNMPPAFQTQLPASVWPVFKSALVATVCVCHLAAPSAHLSSHSDSGLPFQIVHFIRIRCVCETCSLSMCVPPVFSGESHDPASYSTKIALG